MKFSIALNRLNNMKFVLKYLIHNEEQMITGYPIDGAMGSSGG